MLEIGHIVDDFELPNQDGKPIRLSDYRGKKVIVFAFPNANTGGCNAQACAFRDAMEAFQTANAVVLGMSSNDRERLRQWKADKQLPYDLLSDPERKVLEAWGAWGIPLLGAVKFPMVNRSYWVIDENGVLIDRQVGVSPEESAQKALAAVGEKV